MKKLLLLMMSFLIFGCKGDLLPPLPDTDQTINDVDTAIFNDLNSEAEDDVEDVDDETESENDGDVISVDDDGQDADIEEHEDEDINDEDSLPETVSSLLVATVKGYDVPRSGKVYEFDLSDLSVITQSPDDLFGSETGSDTTLAVFDNTFSVLARNYGKDVYFLKDVSEITMNFDTYSETTEDYINFQDMVYNSVKDEYVISAHSMDELVVLKDGVFRRQKFTDDTGIFPVRMTAIGENIYVLLQYLDEQWNSQKAVLAVLDMNDYSAEFIDLGVKNPNGKIEYNPDFDKNHIYTTCSGSWAKRDGAVVRISLKDHKVEKVLSESDEEGSLLDVDLVDISITDNGKFFIVVSDNNANWVNKLYEFDTKEGKISEVDTGVNAFAANPIDYSSDAGMVYYFCDDQEKTFLKARNIETGAVESYELDAGPASIKVWTRFK